jgi:HrpA-like RNA helicase
MRVRVRCLTHALRHRSLAHLHTFSLPQIFCSFIFCSANFLLRDLLPRRPELRVILVSATADAAQFQTYFGGAARAPLLHIPGIAHPVTEIYLEDFLHASGHALARPARSSDRGDGMRRRWHGRADEHAAAAAADPSPDGATAAAAAAGAYVGLSAAARASLDAWALRRADDDIDTELLLAALRFVCARCDDTANGAADALLGPAAREGAVLVFLTGWQDIADVAQSAAAARLDAHRAAVRHLRAAAARRAQGKAQMRLRCLAAAVVC